MKKFKNILTVALTAVLVLTLTFSSILLPDKEYSESERRLLADFPSITLSTIKNGSFASGFEKYSLDNFVFRDFFRTLKAKTVLSLFNERDNNGIYSAGEHLSKLDYKTNISSVEHAASRFSFVTETYFKESPNIYVSVIPDKNLFLAKENGYPDLDYRLLCETLTKKFAKAEFIDITDTLSADSFYFTDTHWRQEKLQDTASRLLWKMNATSFDAFEAVDTNTEFRGVYYGQSSLNPPPEALYYLENETINNLYVYDFEDNKEIPVYDLDAANGRDPYEMFLGGAKSVITVTNESAATSRELVLFRDSFSSSLAPLLSSGYKKITLIDIRYISPSSIKSFIPEGECDVLFLYSTAVLNSSETIK